LTQRGMERSMLTSNTETTVVAPTESRTGRRVLAVVLGAATVAVAAQITVPLAFSPVPMTLSPLAVLIVGGVLGARGGMSALVGYLLLGVSGLPVFAGGLGGAAWLIGPTGGYLLAFPVAAGLCGFLARDRGWTGAMVGAIAGIAVIHLGGLAQLTLITGDLGNAIRLGTLPFLSGDMVKVVVATIAVTTLGPAIRRQL
jgi:biotin transport system substrate-specific component